MQAENKISSYSPDNKYWKIIYLSEHSSENPELNARLGALEFDHQMCEVLSAQTFVQAVKLLKNNQDTAILLLDIAPKTNILKDIQQRLDKKAYPGLCLIAVTADSHERQILLEQMYVDQVVLNLQTEQLIPSILSGLKYSQKISRIQLSQNLLNSVYQVNEVSTGDDYLRDIAENLANLLGVKYVLIAEANVPDETKITTRVVWANDHFGKNFTYDKAGTPCNEVICGQRVIAYEKAVTKRFPDDLILQDMGVESYMGAAILSPAGELIGLIAALDTKPMPNAHLYKPIFDFLASRAGVEFDRQRAEDKLNKINEELEAKVEQRTEELETTHKELLQVAHQAGMADIAAGVLHNVGNIFNSISIACQVMKTDFSRSKLTRLSDAADLLSENKESLFSYLTEDEKGRELPEYIKQLSHVLSAETEKHEDNLQSIIDSAKLVQGVIKNQLEYTKVNALVEECQLEELVDNALIMYVPVLEKNQIKIEKKYTDVPSVFLQKHKFMQVLANIFKNACEAMKETKHKIHILSVVINIRLDGKVQLIVADNGIGLHEKNMQIIFSLGYSTKQGNQGIGLHVSSNYIQEMGGEISVSSGGDNTGASFELALPVS